MSCQAKPTGVGDALTVDNKDVRLFCQFLNRGNADGGLAKREQAGDVGKSYFSPGADCFDNFKAAEVVARPSWPCFHRLQARATFEYDYSRQNAFAVPAEGTIDACDRFGRAFEPCMPDFTRQPLLQVSGL